MKCIIEIVATLFGDDASSMMSLSNLYIENDMIRRKPIETFVLISAVSSLMKQLNLDDHSLLSLHLSKCYGKVRVFFPCDNSLVSARKPHSSGVRSLVVKCLLFNPEGSRSSRCVCANFFTSIPKQKVPTFLALCDSPPFQLCETFFRKFFIVPKGPPVMFLIFCNRANVKKSQMVPVLNFSALSDCSKFSFFLKQGFLVSS